MTFKFMADDLAKFAYAMTPGGASGGMRQGLTALGQGIGQGAGTIAARQFEDQQREAQNQFITDRDKTQRLEDTRDMVTKAATGTGAFSPIQRGAGGGGRSRGTSVKGSAPELGEDNNALTQYQKDVHRFFTSDSKKHGEKLDSLYAKGILARPEDRALELAKQRYLRDRGLDTPLAWGYENVPGLAGSVEGYEPGAVASRLRRNSLAEQLAAGAPAPGPEPLNMRALANLAAQRGMSEEEIYGLLGQTPAGFERDAIAERLTEGMDDMRTTSAEEAGEAQARASQDYLRGQPMEGEVAPEPWTSMVDEAGLPQDAEAQATAELVGVAPDVAAEEALEAPAGPETVEEAMQAEAEARVEQAGFNDEEDRAAAEYNYGVDIGKMDPGARSSLESIALGLSQAGIPFQIESGRRTEERNRELQRQWDAGNRGNLKSRPADNSKHLEGLAVDVKTAGLNDQQYAAVEEAMAAGGWEPEGNYQAGDPRRNHFVYTGGGGARGQVAQQPGDDEVAALAERNQFMAQAPIDRAGSLGGAITRIAARNQAQASQDYLRGQPMQGQTLSRAPDPGALGRGAAGLLGGLGRGIASAAGAVGDVFGPKKISGDAPPPSPEERRESVARGLSDQLGEGARVSYVDPKTGNRKAFGDERSVELPGAGSVPASAGDAFNRVMSGLSPRHRGVVADKIVGNRNGVILMETVDMEPEDLRAISAAMMDAGFDVDYSEPGKIGFKSKFVSYNPTNHRNWGTILKTDEDE